MGQQLSKQLIRNPLTSSQRKPSGLAVACSWKLYFCFDNVISVVTTFLFCRHKKMSKGYSAVVRSLIEVDWGSVNRNSWPKVRASMLGYYIMGKCSSYCQYLSVKQVSGLCWCQLHTCLWLEVFIINIRAVFGHQTWNLFSSFHFFLNGILLYYSGWFELMSANYFPSSVSRGPQACSTT